MYPPADGWGGDALRPAAQHEPRPRLDADDAAGVRPRAADGDAGRREHRHGGGLHRDAAPRGLGLAAELSRVPALDPVYSEDTAATADLQPLVPAHPGQSNDEV